MQDFTQLEMNREIIVRTMTVAIMQPYFCAYIGYFQLISSVDLFVIYDNIKYLKKGWFNRNRILLNGQDRLFTIPLKKDSDYLNVNERYLADDSLKERIKILTLIKSSYKKAPFFDDIYPVLEKIFLYENDNLFEFIHYSVKELCSLLDINTEIIVSSKLDIDHDLKSQDKVLEICSHLGSTTYINAIGGKTLYDKESFLDKDIDLKFIQSRNVEYPQFNHEFVPWLSIIDVLMFNGVEKTKEILEEYDLE